MECIDDTEDKPRKYILQQQQQQPDRGDEVRDDGKNRRVQDGGSVKGLAQQMQQVYACWYVVERQLPPLRMQGETVIKGLLTGHSVKWN